MTPIITQEGSFGGPIIYENEEVVSPNQVRADLQKRKANKYSTRARQQVERLARKDDLGMGTSSKKALGDALYSRDLFA